MSPRDRFDVQMLAPMRRGALLTVGPSRRRVELLLGRPYGPGGHQPEQLGVRKCDVWLNKSASRARLLKELLARRSEEVLGHATQGV